MITTSQYLCFNSSNELFNKRIAEFAPKLNLARICNDNNSEIWLSSELMLKQKNDLLFISIYNSQDYKLIDFVKKVFS